MKSPACCSCPAAEPAPDASAPRTSPVSSGRDQSGVALITVLLIVFLASVTATSLAALQQIATRRSTVLQHQQQARLYALGAEQRAMLVLARDRKQSETDHPGEEWANPLPTFPVEGGAIKGSLRDLQGCFNLNNLWQPASSATESDAGDTDQKTPSEQEGEQAEQERETEETGETGETGETDTEQPNRPAAKPKPADSAGADGSTGAQSGKARLNQAQFQVLQRLLTGLELKPELAQAIADWIDPDQDPQFPDGAEDSDYNVQNPSYLAANRPMISVSELRLVKGMEPEAYDKLAPLVCALPPGTPLNVNTAPARVLAALVEEKDPKELEDLLENPPADGYDNVDDFLSAAKLTVDAQLKAQIGIASQHFLLRVEARVGDGRAMLYSILYRDENGVRVLRRGFGNQE